MANNKRPVETILVATGNQAVVTGDGTLATQSFSDTAGNVNLADGQLGFFVASGNGSGELNAGASSPLSASEEPKIRVSQGTDYSNNPSGRPFAGFFARTHESTELLTGGVKSIRKQAFRAPKLNAWVIGGTVGNADAITLADNTEYSFVVAMRGRRTDRFDSSLHGRPSKTFSVTTPDFTDLGYTAAQKTNWIVKSLVSKINSQSRIVLPASGATARGTENLVAFAVDIAGGSGQALSALDALAGGVAVTGYTGVTTDAETASGTSDSHMGGAFVAAIADSDNDLTTSSTVETTTDPTSGSCGSIIIMGLDDLEAYHDRLPQVKTRLDVGLTAGFAATDGLYESSETDEGEGTYSQWSKYFDNTYGQRKYSQHRVGGDGVVIQLANNLSSTAIYTSYVIQWESAQQVDIAHVSVSPQKCIILVPNASTTTTAALDAALNGIANDLNLPILT